MATGQKDWEHGLCGCCTDPGVACLTFCCPCITYGFNADASGVGHGCFVDGLIWYLLASISCCCVVHTPFRKRIRQKYGIKKSSDCCITTFCSVCAICQEANEIEFQTKKGNQQNYAPQTAPPMQQAPMQYGQSPAQPQGQGYPGGGVMQPPPPSGHSQY